MLKHKHIDKICFGAMAAAVLLTLLLLSGKAPGVSRASASPEYKSRLFDSDRVHTIDIRMEDWETFLETAAEETYSPCTLVIDGETFEQAGLRAKGNNSLRLTEDYGLRRYSLKVEFDHYQEGNSYYGLDKLSLDASFQDNSYLKTYMVYDMMHYMQVPAPLCSYAQVSVNGEPWGLFLAVEEPEEAFARRCFGKQHGNLYKPDYRSLKAENADVALQYVDDDPDSYENIFRKAKFDVTEADKQRLIRALKILDSGENLDQAVNVDQVLRYFTVQVFVMNWDSYLGRTGHNYFLYEEDGVISMLPWDYNLAFGTYALGMTDPIRDPNILINYPIFTPAEGEVMRERPLYHNLMKNDRYFQQYQKYFDQFLREYFESGLFSVRMREAAERIAPYVRKDPTAFCAWEDHLQAVDTLGQVCLLRAESARGQLEGKIPGTFRGQQEDPGAGVDASHIDLRELGDFEDLEQAAKRAACFYDGSGKSSCLPPGSAL